MSETDPMYDEATVVEEPAADPAARNPLVLLAAVVGAVALAIGVWFFLVTPLLLGDDAGSTQDSSAAPDGPGDAGATPGTSGPTSPDGSPTDDPDLTDELEELPLVTFEVFLARDPFEPVVPEPPPAAEIADDDPSAPSPPATGTDGQNGQDGQDPAPDGTVPAPGPAPGPGTDDPDSPNAAPTPRDPDADGDGTSTDDGRILRLVEISTSNGERVAVIQVDSTLFELREGDRFSSNLVVQSIGTDSAVIVHGDDVFTLRLGDRVIK